MLLPHFDPLFPQSMSQGVLIDIFGTPIPMVTMDGKTRFANEVAQFINVSELHGILPMFFAARRSIEANGHRSARFKWRDFPANLSGGRNFLCQWIPGRRVWICGRVASITRAAARVEEWE
ncbi:MAG: hypothetical protein ABI387_07015 [Lacunisphaera sp.]